MGASQRDRKSTNVKERKWCRRASCTVAAHAEIARRGGGLGSWLMEVRAIDQRWQWWWLATWEWSRWDACAPENFLFFFFYGFSYLFISFYIFKIVHSLLMYLILVLWHGRKIFRVENDRCCVWFYSFLVWNEVKDRWWFYEDLQSVLIF